MAKKDCRRRERRLWVLFEDIESPPFCSLATIAQTRYPEVIVSLKIKVKRLLAWRYRRFKLLGTCGRRLMHALAVY